MNSNFGWRWWKSLFRYSWCLEILSDLITVMWYKQCSLQCRLETFALGNSKGLMTRGNSQRQIFQTTLGIFHCFSDFWIITVSNMRPRVALGWTYSCGPPVKSVVCKFRVHWSNPKVCTVYINVMCSLHYCTVYSLQYCNVYSLKYCNVYRLQYCNVYSLKYCTMYSLQYCNV